MQIGGGNCRGNPLFLLGVGWICLRRSTLIALSYISGSREKLTNLIAVPETLPPSPGKGMVPLTFCSSLLGSIAPNTSSVNPRALDCVPSIRLMVAALMLLCTFSTEAQTTLFSEDFTGESGTSGTSAEGISWSATSGSVSGGQYLVSNTTAVWTTSAIDISNYTSLSLSVTITESGTLEGADCIKVEVLVTGGTDYSNQQCDDDPSSISGAAISDGTSAVIRITANTDKNPEDWFFDNSRGVMEARVIGICPIEEAFDELGEYKGERPLYWIYMPELRLTIATAPVPNPHNDAKRRTYDDLFNKRCFSSYIY